MEGQPESPNPMRVKHTKVFVIARITTVCLFPDPWFGMRGA